MPKFKVKTRGFGNSEIIIEAETCDEMYGGGLWFRNKDRHPVHVIRAGEWDNVSVIEEPIPPATATPKADTTRFDR